MKPTETVCVELEGLMLQCLFSSAMAGAAARRLVEQGERERAITALGGNEMSATVKMQLAERLETLIRAGNNLEEAFRMVRNEKWFNRIASFDFAGGLQ